MKKLLGQGVSASCCDYDKRSPLMVSAQEGKESIVKLLVESKANVHALDIFGGNALLGAVKMGHQSVIEVLMEHDARCGRQRDDWGRGGLCGNVWKYERHSLTSAFKKGHTLSPSSSINSQIESGDTL